MAKTKVFQSQDSSGRDLGEAAWIYCPGCKGYHALRIRMPAEPTPEEIADWKANRAGLWTFNGDVERPTFRASLLIGRDHPEMRCHSFITDGQIQFLGDCFHELKGQTVPLPDIDL